MKRKLIAIVLGLSMLLLVPGIGLANNKTQAPQPAGVKSHIAHQVKQFNKVIKEYKQEIREKLQLKDQTQVQKQGAIPGTIQTVKKVETGLEITLKIKSGKIIILKADKNTVVSFKGSLGQLLTGKVEGLKAVAFCSKDGSLKWIKVLPPVAVGDTVYEQKSAVIEQ